MRYWIAKILYNLAWIPWYLTLKFFLHYKIIYQDKSVRKLKGPLIITANHSSWIDPFIISGIFHIFSPVFPIRFAAYPKLFFNPFVGIFVFMMGTFPAQRGIPLNESLKDPVKFIKKGQAVGIFPEGRRRHLGRPRKGRRGAAYLAIHTKSRILPVYIDSSLGINIKNLLLRKKYTSVYVGKPFYPPDHIIGAEDINSLNRATEIIMQKMHELKNMV